ncbi:MAG: radical SAM protein [Deltaproteobacteria bacterium]|nr:radical SAM protein [Deltaproteobacteria bacterium]
MTANYWNEIEILKARYDIPFEAIVKSDLLRLGVHFTPEALQYAKAFKEKSYFIFSFDRVTQNELSDEEKHAAPEEMALMGGPYDFKKTIVSVRLNPLSPYRVEVVSGACQTKDLHALKTDRADRLLSATPPTQLALVHTNKKINENICFISLLERPAYYQKTLSNGKPVSDITPTIEWGYLIYLTAFRICQYWGAKEECAFCDINENYRQQKKERSYTAIKPIDEVIEALTLIQETDTARVSRAYTVSGGSIITDLNGKSEADFYAQYAEAIEKKFPGRWIGKANVQALPKEDVKKLKGAGYQIYHPNLEIWDEKLFKNICPGKERYVGQGEWIKRVVDAAEIFGAQHVIPNFVAGIEMSKPHGFQTVNEAVASTTQGFDFFMSKGIVPRFTVWCVEPNTTLAQTNTEPPPLEYFVALLQNYRDTFRKYKLPTPPGYGEPGLGKAVFSVSAFMDVL